jgi:hypothetical protein
LPVVPGATKALVVLVLVLVLVGLEVPGGVHPTKKLPCCLGSVWMQRCGNFFWFLVVHVRNGCGALLPRVMSGVLLVARLGWFILWILNFEGRPSWLVWCQGYVANVMLKQMGLFFFSFQST